MSDELKVAIEAAKIGAQNALKYFDKDIKVELKEDKSVVTHADRETEEIIKKFISSKFASAKFVGEESGGDVNEKEFWTIDPIDGTRSYVRGIPTWCVIISLCRSGDVQLGAVYFPHIDTVYYAERGAGAFENKKRIHVSSISEVNKAFFSFGSPRHFTDKNVVLDLIDKTSSSRAWDPTYSACLLAAGRTDIHVDSYGKLWDLAAIKVILEEAGGKITRLDGSPWKYDGVGSIMTNGLLHKSVLEIINKRK